MRERDGGFPGERRDRQMKKLERSNPNVTCDGCRHFDGLRWCHRWNYHTEAQSPICAEYRIRAPS